MVVILWAKGPVKRGWELRSESSHESFVNSQMLRSNKDESWWELASGVGQQANIIDELRIKDTQSCKEWTTSNLKWFLQQTAGTFATLINSHDRSNAHKLLSTLIKIWTSSKLMRVDESWWEWMRVGGQTLARVAALINSHQLSSSLDRALTGFGSSLCGGGLCISFYPYIQSHIIP